MDNTYKDVREKDVREQDGQIETTVHCMHCMHCASPHAYKVRPLCNGDGHGSPRSWKDEWMLVINLDTKDDSH